MHPAQWMRIAIEQLGVREVPGPEHNPTVLDYHQATRLMADADEVPWCSAFVCWVMEKAGFKSTRSALARSWQDWGEELKHPKHGCIVVMWRGKPDSWSGHVGFYVGSGYNTDKVLGGNQGNLVTVKDYDRERVLSYRWPTKSELK